MLQAPALSSELIRLSAGLARALSSAARNWALYPQEHPSIGASLTRLTTSVAEATGGAAFAFGVTPATLLVAGLPLPGDPPIAETARLLHDRDILQLSFIGIVPDHVLAALLKLLALSPDDLRARGGPGALWAAEGHPSIAIEQIDYEKILEDHDVDRPLEHRDDVWRSVVNAIVSGNGEFDEAQQRRLLDISRSVFEIGELASDVMEPKRNADGSPLITTQAATVLAVFRHLAGIVTVMEPERITEVMRNVTTATTRLDPHVVLQMMQSDDTSQINPIVAKIAASFDDEKVAQLLATALSKDGRASARLAQVFDTIAPDDARKRRVLTMARTMLSEQDFGKSSQFRAVWSSMETLLLSYDESPYVSSDYQASLEGAGDRAAVLAGRELPPELPAWIESLGQDNVRALSVMLITDLLRIEKDPERAADIAQDMAYLIDDLLLAGDFANSLVVLRELDAAARGAIAATASRAALTSIGESSALAEAAAGLGDLDDAAFTRFADGIALIGHTAVQALLPALAAEDPNALPYVRARQLSGRCGSAAAPHLAPLALDDRWFVQRNAAVLLGETRSADAVPSLQILLRKSDPRVVGLAVSALTGIDDPAAVRAIQTAMRAATGEARRAILDALVGERNSLIVPMLSRILSDTDPFGGDHSVVLDALDAVRQLADDRATPSIVATMRRTRFFGGKKARAFKGASVTALMAIGTGRARAAIDDAARTGDRLLRRAARAVQSA